MSRKKRKNTKNKPISKKEFIFNAVSMFILIIICVYFGYRSMYYYSKQNNTKQSTYLVDKIISNNKITNEKDGFHQETNGYSFKGIVLNNYVRINNQVYRILRINEDNSITIVSDDNNSILIWGEETSYKKSNINNWLNKTELENSGVFYNTISNTDLLKKTEYSENTLLNKKVKVSTKKSNDFVTTLTISDYINAGGKNSFLNINKYFWLIGKDKDDSNIYVDETGSVSSGTNYDAYGVRGVITLNKNTESQLGVGTIDNPYIIDTDEKINTVDSYVKLGEDIWKVYSDSNNILKLVSTTSLKLDTYSKKTSEFTVKDKTNIACYLNKVYYNSLSYKSLLLDQTLYTGEISNETGLSMNNIYSDSLVVKVGLPNIFDYNTNTSITDYYYMNTTSTVGSMAYVNNNLGILDEDKVTEKKNIVPTISIDKTLIKSGEGTISSPYTVE